ncbi:YbdK family carboxylate-amine ligase [Nocardioides sp. MAH-18]|uniref:Putative glutamate--cysteine ligase 2 n=1 Tax=Nocardioides agri TaxID=2682843 RepID=A0A6L6XVZ7_9ACTN|nr:MULTISPECIES: glutamate--cysteine ligase [unclassified Nocardioides]MBA2952399.1 glutamate--cysteine ligase [Nocardioides sp. CGMCC 1.13656]MVQ51561.1 YbdK family carboxylate-amine ligase [Nocardioides sp. MAH-18]
MVRTVGVEEELLLLDPTTREVVAAAPALLKEFREHGAGRRPPRTSTDELDHELFRHQLETRTDPATDLDDVLDQVLAARRTAVEAARAVGLRIGACGIVPLGGARSVVTSNDRYRDMLQTYGEIARTGGTCGMHVHTSIESEEEGVAVIDRITPWLPVLLALSANSPYVAGHDSGYASWRAQVWTRWPSAGPTEQFGSVAGYREASRALLDSGAARDVGMLYFDARLSVAHPTVEIRICDVCTEPRLAAAIVALARGMVECAARDWRAGEPLPRWRAEALRAAHWRASRYGMADTLVHPATARLAPAREVLDALVDRVRPALEETGDLERVEAAVQRSVSDNGATRQRAAFERTGELTAVVDDLVARTEASWQTPEPA